MKLITIVSLVLACLLSAGCVSSSRDFDTRLSSIVRAHRFSIAGWEFEAIPQQVSQWLSGSSEEADDEADVVTEYFNLVKRIKALKSEIQAVNAGNSQGNLASLEAELDSLREERMDLAGIVERAIERQIRETLTQQGIFNPIDEYVRLEIGFPPVSFNLGEPPRLLVISPRDRIESLREILLQPDLSPEEIEDIEAEADKLGVSSLVVKPGGLGATYPTFVTNESSLKFTIDTATEEWLHQYLAFRPLGFLYLLDLTGVSRSYEIATMNETVASMVSKEIGSIIREKYYPEYINAGNQTEAEESEFDFNREMREIRKTVDDYLARGEVEQAEEFMEQKRQYLASMGHYIRKLNQAYFAFHGTYADSPTSISPIGLELKELRNQSASLKDFLNAVAGMSNRQELIDSIK